MTKLNKLSTETIRDFEEVELAKKDDSELIYVKEPNVFSSMKQLDNILADDIQQVRHWKNKVVEIRDKYKGTPMYVTWDLELRRVVDFLMQFSQ